MSAGTLQLPSPESSWEPSYIAIVWGRECSLPRLAEKLRVAVPKARPALKVVFEMDGLILLAAADDNSLRVLVNRDRTTALIGAAFHRDGESLQAEALDEAPRQAAKVPGWLFARCWGAYLAVSMGDGSEVHLARDPSGNLPAHVIDAGGVAVVSDHLPAWLADLIGRAIPIDRAMLANALAMPLLTTHRSLLQNIEHIPAGGVVSWKGRLEGCRLAWRPADSWHGGAYDPERMHRSVFAAVRAWRSAHRRILIELSGGLDSAIVLGALATVGGFEHVAAVNLATTYAGGDERELARAAASKWDIELVEFLARDTELNYESTLSGPQPLQPNLYGLDPLLEACVRGAASTFGSDAVLTGQGGDAVFFQVPSEKVAIDYMRAKKGESFFSGVAFDAARRSRRSIWRIHWLMLRDWIAGTAPDRMPAAKSLLGRHALGMFDPSLGDHPWLADAADLPPAKQTQILTVANCQLFNGPTRRGELVRLRHPLMAQPVMESWLAAPSYVLSMGTQDRAFARQLFADLLPTSIARRRGKGETSIYYRRSLVENLSFLRSHMLEGTLVAHGLLDADRLGALLNEQAMLWSEEARMIPSLASLEAWARYWRL